MVVFNDSCFCWILLHSLCIFSRTLLWTRILSGSYESPHACYPPSLCWLILVLFSAHRILCVHTCILCVCSPACTSSLLRRLICDAKDRLTFKQIKHHPWFKVRPLPPAEPVFSSVAPGVSFCPPALAVFCFAPEVKVIESSMACSPQLYALLHMWLLYMRPLSSLSV